MSYKVPREELNNRIDRLCQALDAHDPGWQTALITNRVNQYYLTGTMQDGLLVLQKEGNVIFFVRRSFERAKEESPLDNIYAMRSYSDMLSQLGPVLGRTYMETELVPLAMLQRLQKYFTFAEILPLDSVINKVRAVKSSYELDFIKESGRQHRTFLLNVVPDLLREGMSEAELTGELFRAMVRLGHHGVARFAGFQTEIVVGQLGFGENSLAPTNFDGPGGMQGFTPALPCLGSRDRCLKRGDMVFIDIAYGFMGYHTDRTQVYCYKGTPSAQAAALHKECMEVQRAAAAELKSGNIPSEIYAKITAGLSNELARNFMGYGPRRVSFLGHGVGLYVDEYPVIARGFNEPLAENMVIALEPKTGVPGIGTVGVEDTYLVTSTGGTPLTGGGEEIIEL